MKSLNYLIMKKNKNIGIILSSRTVEYDLSVYFGDILPIELPLKNKRALDYNVDLLNSYCEDIIITIPEGYEIKDLPSNSQVHQINSDLNFYDVLKKLESITGNYERIFIVYGDTIVSNVKKLAVKNYCFVSEPNFNYKWGPKYKNKSVPVGFYIFEKIVFKKLLVNNNYDDFINQIYSDRKIIKYDDFKWFDIGHSFTYFFSKKNFLETRHFNSLKIEEDFLLKQSKDVFKIWAEFNWLKEIKKVMPSNIPEVIDFNIIDDIGSYRIKYLDHPTLSDLFVFGKINLKAQSNILNKLNQTLLEMHNFKNSFSNENSNFYVNKLLERKDEIFKVIEKSGESHLFFKKVFDKNLNFFDENKKDFSVIHGDFCFSNIIYDILNNRVFLIDPRGFTDKKVGFSLYGPKDYDIFKIAHSYIFGYDRVIANNYSLDFFEPIEIEKRLNIFLEIFKIDRAKLLMGCSHLFLTLIPLHSDNLLRQIYFLKIIRIIENT